MKTISVFITEKLKVSSNVNHGDCTVQEFLEWYYFGYEQTIEDLTFDEFTVIDFDPSACETYFNNNEQKMYDFLMNNLDIDIELHKVKEGDYTYYRFFIHNVEFMAEYYEDEFEKKK
jgi:hypothetical protein